MADGDDPLQLPPHPALLGRTYRIVRLWHTGLGRWAGWYIGPLSIALFLSFFGAHVTEESLCAGHCVPQAQILNEILWILLLFWIGVCSFTVSVRRAHERRLRLRVQRLHVRLSTPLAIARNLPKAADLVDRLEAGQRAFSDPKAPANVARVASAVLTNVAVLAGLASLALLVATVRFFLQEGWAFRVEKDSHALLALGLFLVAVLLTWRTWRTGRSLVEAFQHLEATVERRLAADFARIDRLAKGEPLEPQLGLTFQSWNRRTVRADAAKS